MSKADSTSPSGRKTSVSSVDSGGARKTTFDLEPNPFEQSFAAPEDDGKKRAPRLSHSRNTSMDNNPHKSPKLTPLARVFTPGGNRILPPLSEIAQSGSGTNTPSAGISGFETGPLSPAIFLQKPQNGTPGFAGWSGTPGAQSPGAFSSLVSSLRHRSFAESGIRSGLTPGGQLTPISAAAAVAAQEGKTTPGGLSALFNLDTPDELKSKPNGAPAPQAVPTPVAVPPAASAASTAPVAAPAAAPPAKTAKKGKKREKKDTQSSPDPPQASPPLKKRKKTKMEIKMEEEEAAMAAAEGDEPQDEEEKRKCFLERNRVAALKCRQRKKQWLANLEAKVEFYASENDNLNQQIARLRDQVKGLKGIVMDFKNGNGAKIPAATLDEVLNTNIVISNVPATVPIPQVPQAQPVQPVQPVQQVPVQQMPQQVPVQQQMPQQVPVQQQMPQQHPQGVPQVQNGHLASQQVPLPSQIPPLPHQPMMMGKPIEHGEGMMGMGMQAGGMQAGGMMPQGEEGERVVQPLYM